MQSEKLLANELNDLINNHHIPNPPLNRIYNIGDRVKWGAHQNSFVLEVSEDKRFYKLKTTNVKTKFDKEIKSETINWVAWTDIFFYTSLEEEKNREVLSSNDDIFLRQFNSTINSILNLAYTFGLDFDAEYQRDYVWSLQDKQNLIDSILNNIEIGKFLLIRREWKEKIKKNNKMYEILDGKQRISTIMEFYESRFQYKGKYFHELSFIDKNKFYDHHITYMEGENLNEQDRIKLFIRVNTTGKVMDVEHLNNVRKLLK